MTTQTIEATYEHGVLKPRRKLPFREHARITLKVLIPAHPVKRTAGVIRVAPRTARAIISGDEADFFNT